MAIDITKINYIEDGETVIQEVLNRPTQDLVDEVDNELSSLETNLKSYSDSNDGISSVSVSGDGNSSVSVTVEGNDGSSQSNSTSTSHNHSLSDITDSGSIASYEGNQNLRTTDNVTFNVVEADRVNFVNKESTDLSSDGDVIWDLSDGFYNQRNGTAYQVWDSGNDGSGSGLNADTLDGNHASAFTQSSGDNPSADWYEQGVINMTGGDNDDVVGDIYYVRIGALVTFSWGDISHVESDIISTPSSSVPSSLVMNNNDNDPGNTFNFDGNHMGYVSLDSNNRRLRIEYYNYGGVSFDPVSTGPGSLSYSLDY